MTIVSYTQEETGWGNIKKSDLTDNKRRAFKDPSFGD